MTRGREWLTSEVQWLRANSGKYTTSEVAAQLGRTKHSIRLKSKVEGVTLVNETPVPRKLYAEHIAAAMELRTAGWRWSQIAEVLSFSPGTISSAVTNAKIKGMEQYPPMARSNTGKMW